MHNKGMTQLRAGLSNSDALRVVLDGFRRGDYQAAAEASEGLRVNGKKTTQYCFYLGSALMQTGQMDAAERLLRESLRFERESNLCAIGYSQLGQLLIALQRLDEAMECLEISLRYWPDRGSSLRDVAEIWLLRDKSETALSFARQAVEQDRRIVHTAPSDAFRETCELNLSEDLATLAWAVAASSSDRAEVERLVGEAVSLAGEKSVSSTAQVHCHAGKAYLALEDVATSTHHFQQAAQADPQGIWGREAQAMLSGSKR